MVHENSLENLKKGKDTQFPQGQSGNPKGRPKKLYNKFKGQGYSAEETKEVMSFILTMTKEERAKHLADNPDGLENLCIRALELAIARGNYSKMKDIIDIVMGGKKINLNGKLKLEQDYSNLTDEQLLQLHKLLEAAEKKE